MYVKDLPVLQASIEAIKNICQKIANDKKVLVVGVVADGVGNREAGIQEGSREQTNFFEVKAIDMSVNNDFAVFPYSQRGRRGFQWVDAETDKAKYRLYFKPIKVQVKIVYHCQDVPSLYTMLNKWLYWQEKLSFKLQLLNNPFQISVTPEENTNVPDKDKSNSEDYKLEFNFTMGTFAGIIEQTTLIKSIALHTKLSNGDTITDEETDIVEDEELNKITLID